MNNVIKMKEDKDSYKIEGEAYERVKLIGDKIDREQKRGEKIAEILRAKYEKLHDEYWQAIYREAGIKYTDQSYSVKEFHEHGILIVEKNKDDDCKHKILEKYLEINHDKHGS